MAEALRLADVEKHPYPLDIKNAAAIRARTP